MAENNLGPSKVELDDLLEVEKDMLEWIGPHGARRGGLRGAGPNDGILAADVGTSYTERNRRAVLALHAHHLIALTINSAQAPSRYLLTGTGRTAANDLHRAKLKARRNAL